MYRKIIYLLIFVLMIVYSSLGIESIDNYNDEISIEIKGEVEKNKVIKAYKGQTINDILNEINLTNNSDISDISLNTKLYNNQIIVIPSKKSKLNRSISINNANIEELISLPGIGEKTAINIINYRNKYGFNSLEDIKNVKGIGDKKYNSIKEYICL